MTPQDCLTCPVADLMPVCARIMGEGWRAIHLAGAWRIIHEETTAYLELSNLSDAFRLQAEIARRGLRGEFAEQLMDIVNSTGDAMDLSTAAEWWRLATATAEQRCRACCAALLEHEQRKGTA